MAEQPPSRVSSDELFSQHRKLMERVGALERFRLTRDDASQEWADAVWGEIKMLVEQLEEHFRWEEQSDLYTSLAERFPRFDNSLQRLRQEHGEILAELRAVLERCADRGIGSRGISLCERLLAVLSKLRRHEAEEAETVHRAYSEDIGSGD